MDLKFKKICPKFLKNLIKLKILNIKNKNKNIIFKSYKVSNDIILEDNIFIDKECIIENNVKIGRHTYLQPYCNLNNTEIGRFCSIGLNVTIGPWQHPIKNISTSPKLYRNIIKSKKYNDTPKKTIIGNDVWIGSNTIIMGGIKIGDGSVIGAGSIITHDVPPYAIVVGNPGKIIKFRFSSEKIEILLQKKWWNWTENDIEVNKDFFEQ